MGHPRRERRHALLGRLERMLAIAADPCLRRRARTRAARRAACLAERAGLIERPRRCEWCRRRLPLDRHHPDHREPLMVYFLCQGCHEVADEMGRATA